MEYDKRLWPLYYSWKWCFLNKCKYVTNIKIGELYSDSFALQCNRTCCAFLLILIALASSHVRTHFIFKSLKYSYSHLFFYSLIWSRLYSPWTAPLPCAAGWNTDEDINMKDMWWVNSYDISQRCPRKWICLAVLYLKCSKRSKSVLILISDIRNT